VGKDFVEPVRHEHHGRLIRRDGTEEALPQLLQDKCLARLYCGHFFCHVFHQDYVIRKGVDPKACKDELLAHFHSRGTEYPAEHNVGHIDKAKPPLADF
jgi:D-lactate dehydrogenase